MRLCPSNLIVSSMLACACVVAPAAAQNAAEKSAVPCRDLPCAVRVDWTREGGVGNLLPDRRYGNAANLEEKVKARLTELGLGRHGGGDDRDLVIVLVPRMGNAICDEVAGTATDRSCRAITDVQARVEGPDEVRSDVDIPSRIRNTCSSDKMMPVDRLGIFLGDWISYALEGKAKGERRPVARC